MQGFVDVAYGGGPAYDVTTVALGENIPHALRQVGGEFADNFLQDILQRNHTQYLPVFVDNRRQVVVESSTPIDGQTRERVETGLQQKYGSDLSFEFSVNPDLIGGMRIRVGNDVWDGSVKARLARLSNSF